MIPGDINLMKFLAKVNKPISLTAILILSASTVSAGMCDYRPSNLIGGVGAGAAASTGASVAAAGIGAKVAGFYTLTHAVTGATMLGSTAGGVSAAGTVGIMGGTAGIIGTVGSVIMAPLTIITGIVVGAGTAIFEGSCYFLVERVEDPKVIMTILENLAANSDKKYFELVKSGIGSSAIYVATEVDENGKVLERKKYKIDKLYIEEGMLKHKDYGPNSQIGKVGYVTKLPETSAAGSE